MKPMVFFRGEYAFRTFNGAMGMVAALLPGVLGAAAAVYVSTRGKDTLAFFVGAIFAAVALVFGGLGLRSLLGLIGDRRIPVEINESGIVCGNRFWPWARVRSFAGTRYDNGVCLGFTPRDVGVCGGGGLPTTPLLTEEQYVDLARELSRWVAARHPDVVVMMHPLKATADS